MNIDPPYQGNIITTKPEAPKKYQNDIKPTPVSNDASSLHESTIIQKPSDKPINLDMNAFLGETQKTKKDIEIMNDVKLSTNL